MTTERDCHDHKSKFTLGMGIPGWLAELAHTHGSRPMLVWAPFEGVSRTWTYSQFLSDVQKLAGGLVQRDIKRGDRVLVHMDNCPEALLVRFACAWIGAVCVATNTSATSDDLKHFTTSSRAVCAITQNSFVGLVESANEALRWIAVVDGSGLPHQASDRCFDFSLLEAAPVAPLPVDTGQAASIMFTTGTTAKPKGVVWSHENVLWAASLNARQQGMRPDDIHLIFLPLFHVVGLSWGVLSTMSAGGTIVLQPRFSRQRYWESAIRHQATVASHVNFTTSVLATEPVPEHKLRLWMNPKRDSALERYFGVPFLAGWGMTEVLCQVVVSPLGSTAETGSIGQQSAAYEIRLEDENAKPVPLPGSGHLLVRGVRGVSLFQEYDGDVHATNAAFDDNGFFATGDRVRIDEDGSVFFQERLKDIIKVGGENVSAAEVEYVIAGIPGVKEVAVVAKPDKFYGELVVAFIVPQDDCSSQKPVELSSKVKEQCERQLSRFKCPTEVIVIEALPRIGVGKISKAALRQLAMRSPQDAAFSVRMPSSVFREP